MFPRVTANARTLRRPPSVPTRIAATNGDELIWCSWPCLSLAGRACAVDLDPLFLARGVFEECSDRSTNLPFRGLRSVPLERRVSVTEAPSPCGTPRRLMGGIRSAPETPASVGSSWVIPNNIDWRNRRAKARRPRTPPLTYPSAWLAPDRKPLPISLPSSSSYYEEFSKPCWRHAYSSSFAFTSFPRQNRHSPNSVG